MVAAVDVGELDVANRALPGATGTQSEYLALVRRYDEDNPTQSLIIALVRLGGTVPGVNSVVNSGTVDMRFYNSNALADFRRTRSLGTGAPSSNPTLAQLLGSTSSSQALSGGGTAYTGQVNGSLPGGLSLSTQLVQDSSAYLVSVDGIVDSWAIWGVAYGSDFSGSFTIEFARTP